MTDNVETKQYSDGTSVTGTAPLPDVSPAQQDSLVARLRAIEGQEWEHTLTYNGVRLEAADRIEALETTVTALTETLRQTSERANHLERQLEGLA